MGPAALDEKLLLWAQVRPRITWTSWSTSARACWGDRCCLLGRQVYRMHELTGNYQDDRCTTRRTNRDELKTYANKILRQERDVRRLGIIPASNRGSTTSQPQPTNGTWQPQSESIDEPTPITPTPHGQRDRALARTVGSLAAAVRTTVPDASSIPRSTLAFLDTENITPVPVKG